MYILAIETSCDETSAAVFHNNKLLSNSVYSHLVHKNYGGVFPEEASREHEINIIDTVLNALNIVSSKNLTGSASSFFCQYNKLLYTGFAHAPKEP